MVFRGFSQELPFYIFAQRSMEPIVEFIIKMQIYFDDINSTCAYLSGPRFVRAHNRALHYARTRAMSMCYEHHILRDMSTVRGVSKFQLSVHVLKILTIILRIIIIYIYITIERLKYTGTHYAPSL